MATNLYLENYLPVVKDARGVLTKLPVTLSGTAANLAVGGTATFTGAVTFSAGVVGGVSQESDNQNQVAAASYAVSHTMFLNSNQGATYKVVALSAVFGTASSSGTLQVEVATGTQAIAAGTVQLTGTVSLAGTANTPVNGTIIASPTTITSGARVNLIFAGTVTNLANASVTVALQRLS